MVYTHVALAAVLFGAATEPHPISLVNGDFELDAGPFNIPVGWVPFGGAKHEGRHEGNWKAQVADAHALHKVGLYQVVANVTPGTRYRLTADALCGNPQLPIRIGLAAGGSVEEKDIAWSADHLEKQWRSLYVEANASSSHLIVFLQMRNLNRTYQLLDAGAWDHVRLSALGPERPPSGKTITTPETPPPSDVFAGLADLWSLAWPRTGVRTWQAGTHHPDPENNSDFDRVEGRIRIDGRPWTVLKTLTGPGAIARIWMTNFERRGRIRIEVDERPVVECGLFDFFGGHEVFSWPLANRTSGGWMCYVPIAFRRSARILVADAEQKHFYWQITSQTLPAENVRPFALPLSPADAEYFQRIRAQWAAASVDPKPRRPETQSAVRIVDLPAQGSAELLSLPRPGMIGAVHIDLPSDAATVWQGLRLKAFWDGASSPQIDAPLGLFFGSGGGRGTVRGLLMGMVPPDGGYCYFPMPFSSAKIDLVNTTAQPVAPTRCRIEWLPVDKSNLSPMRFHAFYRDDPRAGENKLYYPLESEGAGHLVGMSAALACGNVRDVHYLEGDEYVWVDGEKDSSISGTGTEDYFTCGWYFMDGPITLPPIGATEIDRPGCAVNAYRLHVPDYIPFTRSIRFGLEVGDRTSSPEYGRYRTVCYYYLRKSGSGS